MKGMALRKNIYLCVNFITGIRDANWVKLESVKACEVSDNIGHFPVVIFVGKELSFSSPNRKI